MGRGAWGVGRAMLDTHATAMTMFAMFGHTTHGWSRTSKVATFFMYSTISSKRSPWEVSVVGVASVLDYVGGG